MSPGSALRARATVDLHDLRVAGALMLAGALCLPLLPGPDGPPCPLRSLTGIPCPLCGMTTSVIAAAHLHPMTSLAASPAGTAAVLVALAVLLARRRQQVVVPLWVFFAGLALMEAWQLARFGFL